uniref:OTU deubiquitinase with linear linkage specificity a n=1 Tax=Neogobius melanostomus TaxID=47308 RepID=A0A8C6V3L0_9GOBI
MSWFKSVSYSGEDVFDENADELHLQSREWSSNMKRRVRDGYVDGVDAGEEASLQPGFNLGFRDGATQTVDVGRLKGIVTAIRCWCQSKHPEHSSVKTMSDILHQVNQLEDSIMEGIRRTLENPPASVSDVSESMEDLGVMQEGGSCCSGECCKEKDCNKGGDKMDTDIPQQPQRRCPGVSGSSNCEDELVALLQRCTQTVTELGLPPELTSYIETIRKI